MKRSPGAPWSTQNIKLKGLAKMTGWRIILPEITRCWSRNVKNIFLMLWIDLLIMQLIPYPILSHHIQWEITRWNLHSLYCIPCYLTLRNFNSNLKAVIFAYGAWSFLAPRWAREVHSGGSCNEKLIYPASFRCCWSVLQSTGTLIVLFGSFWEIVIVWDWDSCNSWWC